MVQPGTSGYAAILSHFLPTTPDLLQPSPPAGNNGDRANLKGQPLNRAALGHRVFGDSEESKHDREVLNGIIHPAVRREMLKAVLYYYVRGHWAVVLDIPLLYESGLDLICGVVMVVAVRNPHVQLARLRARDPHLSPKEAEERVAAQYDVRLKARRAEKAGDAGIVVWNDGAKDTLEKEIEKIIIEIKRRRPNWWAWLLVLTPLGAFIALWNVLRALWRKKEWEHAQRQEKLKL